MKLTVLQSVYKKDNPRYLHECFYSIANQTLPANKIVLVKDGVLTPDLEKVINDWQGKLPLQVVGYGENKGLAYALNYGLQYVDTELVARMDSDDICYPDRFEKQVIQFEVDPSIMILGGGIEEFYIDSAGNEIRKIRLYPKYTNKTSSSLYKGTPIAHPTMMMKTDLLKKFKYSEQTNCNEDIDLWFRLLEKGFEIKTLQEPILHFRITDETFNRRSVSKAFREFSFYFRNLFMFNGISIRLLLPFIRLGSRFFPKSINKKLYLSQKRQQFFKEHFMKIISLRNQIFVKENHVFEALVQFEENGIQIVKAVQLDTESKIIVEVPLKEIKLLKISEPVDIELDPDIKT